MLTESDRTIDAVAAPCVVYEVREFESPTANVVFIEDAFRQPAEESGHPILEHAAAWRQ
jgi:hypothetical protein